MTSEKYKVCGTNPILLHTRFYLHHHLPYTLFEKLLSISNKIRNVLPFHNNFSDMLLALSLRKQK